LGETEKELEQKLAKGLQFDSLKRALNAELDTQSGIILERYLDYYKTTGNSLFIMVSPDSWMIYKLSDENLARTRDIYTEYMHRIKRMRVSIVKCHTVEGLIKIILDMGE
jgi:23S rRNA G2069 N7-methylase RlmK/C1962 C5-methylase RlmI